MTFLSKFFRKNNCLHSTTLEQAKERFPTFRYALVCYKTNRPIYLSEYSITEEDIERHIMSNGVLPVKVVDLWNEV